MYISKHINYGWVEIWHDDTPSNSVLIHPPWTNLWDMQAMHNGMPSTNGLETWTSYRGRKGIARHSPFWRGNKNSEIIAPTSCEVCSYYSLCNVKWGLINPSRLINHHCPKRKCNLKTGGPPRLINTLAYPRLINHQCWNPFFYPTFFISNSIYFQLFFYLFLIIIVILQV